MCTAAGVLDRGASCQTEIFHGTAVKEEIAGGGGMRANRQLAPERNAPSQCRICLLELDELFFFMKNFFL
jgi:hypothetical protein